MMHPARQAYVEEDDPEVSHFFACKTFNDVHMVSQRKPGCQFGEIEEVFPSHEEISADGLGLGCGDGG